MVGGDPDSTTAVANMTRNPKFRSPAEYLPPATDTFQAPNASKPNQVAQAV
jgi:hypothetical protein